MKFETIEEWRDAASLQFTVYMPFVNWLRKEKDLNNDDICFLSPNKLARYEKEYFNHMKSLNWD